MIKFYKKLFNYVPEKRYLLIFTLLFSTTSAVLQIIAFYYLYEFLNKLIIIKDFQIVNKSAIKIVLFMLFSGFFYFFSQLISHLFAFRLETNLRKFGINALTNASFSFFDINSSGKIRKILDDNAAQTHMAVAHLIPDNIGAILTPILVLLLGFFINFRLGIILLILVILSFSLMHFMMGEKTFMKIYQTSLEKLSAETVEYIRGIQIIKTFDIDVRSFKVLNNAIKEYAKYAYDYSLSCKKPYVIFQTLFFGIIAIILPLLIFLTNIEKNPESIAVELIMLFFLSGVLFTIIMKVMYLSMYIFQAQDAVNKLEEFYISMQKDTLKFGEEKELKSTEIEFENVSFGYTEELILKNLSFKLESGKIYALIGSSGSGKSTIAKLISGFYKINEGFIKIGGKNIIDYSKETIINNIAFVFQDTKLFKMSIYENVALANKNANREEVMKALKLAGCDNILSKFHDGEKTIIGSKGVYLSGGEKQRIAIARAILKNAKIIIFDEASAAIDFNNEYELQKAFSNLIKNKTVIMIAHRLTSIKNVDEILVLEDGKIIERGKHKELMKKSIRYKYFQDLYKKANDWRVLDERII